MQYNMNLGLFLNIFSGPFSLLEVSVAISIFSNALFHVARVAISNNFLKLNIAITSFII